MSVKCFNCGYCLMGHNLPCVCPECGIRNDSNIKIYRVTSHVRHRVDLWVNIGLVLTFFLLKIVTDYQIGSRVVVAAASFLMVVIAACGLIWLLLMHGLFVRRRYIAVSDEGILLNTAIGGLTPEVIPWAVIEPAISKTGVRRFVEHLLKDRCEGLYLGRVASDLIKEIQLRHRNQSTNDNSETSGEPCPSIRT